MNIDEVVLTCCHEDCGISFAVPNWWHRGKRESHAWFYCPNGHRQHFAKESDSERFRRERDNALQQRARLEQELVESQLEAVKAQRKAKRLEKRAAAGVCPCCNRTFSDMARHMKSKHPSFSEDNVIKLAAR